jgi:hypothetical protein
MSAIGSACPRAEPTIHLNFLASSQYTNRRPNLSANILHHEFMPVRVLVACVLQRASILAPGAAAPLHLDA